MLPGHGEHLACPDRLEDLVNGIEFLGFPEMTEVARVDQEVRSIMGDDLIYSPSNTARVGRFIPLICWAARPERRIKSASCGVSLVDTVVKLL
jgi:hypothetical protein